ncbi:unnamed protein product [Onchocerca flexuosa]|uniref:Uncharacterized protein n=1 Tax=Onchocerca flexuosa TaxID=387005 RepID=A0A183HXJ9_9BILA|nr:unnamed protein product [Onchocerca flexuosa]
MQFTPYFLLLSAISGATRYIWINLIDVEIGNLLIDEQQIDGLRSAVMQMQSLINIRHLPENDRLNAKSLTSCTTHWHPSTDKCFMETVHDWQKSNLIDITKDINLKFYNVNFLLFLQVIYLQVISTVIYNFIY